MSCIIPYRSLFLLSLLGFQITGLLGFPVFNDSIAAPSLAATIDNSRKTEMLVFNTVYTSSSKQDFDPIDSKEKWNRYKSENTHVGKGLTFHRADLSETGKLSYYYQKRGLGLGIHGTTTICSNCINRLGSSVSTRYEQHKPVIIDDNNDFYTLGFNGSGTINDPYRIEELNITSSMGYLIEIKDTTAYFTINNCVLNGLGTSFGGIFLENVSNGVISSNIIHNNDEYGIYAAYSSNRITIINNTLFNNSAGIGVTRSAYNNKIINNTACNNLKWNGILVSYDSYSNEIINNTLYNSGWHGILLWSSATSNTVVNNTAYNNNYNGIWIANYSSNNTISSNTFYGNSESGVSISYSGENTITNNFISSNHNDGIRIDGSSNNSVSGNDVINNTYNGIAVTFDYGNYYASTNNMIESNNIYDNGENGISITSFSNNYNYLASNVVFNNQQHGISVDESDNNTIICNTVYDNANAEGGTGIAISRSEYSTVVNNTIYFNGLSQDPSYWGIVISGSDNSFISNNTVFNTEFAIQLEQKPASHHNRINDNIIHDNINGILITGYNNSVTSNNVYNNDLGIRISNAVNSTVDGNELSNREHGVLIEGSDRIFISSNVIYGHSEQGIFILDSNNCNIHCNLVHSNGASGIDLVRSNNSIVTSNTVYENNIGIFLETVNFRCSIASNSVYNNEGGVFLLDGSNENSVINNSLYFNDPVGMIICDSDSNQIYCNTFSSHFGYAISLDSLNEISSFNIIKQNNFIGNNIGHSQARDDGLNNVFLKNYWDDLTGSDENLDGIIDVPYAIEGSSGNTDPSPAATYITISHWLSAPVITRPAAGETIKGNYTIQWTAASDPLGHDVIYSVYYSTDEGRTWILIVSDLTVTTYTWDTASISNGANYMIVIEATCSTGESVVIISDGLFTIKNATSIISLIVQVLTSAILLVSGIGVLAYFVYNYQFRKQPQSFHDFMQSTQLEFLKAVYQKVITGLENISLTEVKVGVLPETIATTDLTTVDQAAMVNFFPPDIRNDLLSGMKGRTVLTLIEIACHYPSEINPTKLASILDIPQSTLSNEIRRLMEMDYIEASFSNQILRDARYRNYAITPKGTKFLHILKGALEISIARLKESQIGN